MFSSSQFTGPYSTGSVNTNPPNVTTNWYNTQTTLGSLTTTTFTANMTAQSIIATLTMLCPLTDLDFLNGWSVYDLPDPCPSLLDPYCNADPNQPSPSSTSFPASCTPVRTVVTSSSSTTTINTSTTSSTSSIPTPTEPSTIPTCQNYHLVVSGDTCFDLAQANGITLNQVFNSISFWFVGSNSR
jgi:hypothetical protein